MTRVYFRGARGALALLAGTATMLSAQTAAPLHSAAVSITGPDVQRRINVIADDSMLGRDTPSRGLELTAAYVADQFKMFGLKPGGENGTYFQRYSITRTKLDVTASHVGFTIGGKQVQVDLSRDARFAFGGSPPPATGGTAVLVGGAMSPAGVEHLDVKGKVVLAIIDYAKPLTAELQQTLGTVLQGEPKGVVLISNRDSAAFQQRVAGQGMARVSVGPDENAPVVEVHQRALAEVLQAAGLDLAAIRGSTGTVTRELPQLDIRFDLVQTVLDSASAPNTIGILEGSDSKLKGEYLIYSAHMDHIGITPGQADSINNGADDDGSGTAGVMELAEAFSQKGARPRRSVIFMTVSGEEKGLWGSAHFADHPTVPLAQVVADLNIDMIGRNWKDTIVAIGKEHSDLGATLNRVNAAHPELHMTAIDDRWPEENFYSRSDHYNFARKGVPILFFFNGVHADYHQVTDSPDKIDNEKESRILQLLFYLGQDIANAAERPKWNPDSYAKVVEGR